jgi:membrane-associated phospholipid phosphatase
MKKEFLGMPLFDFLFIGALCHVGILFGSFFDWQISSNIVNQGTLMGKLVEGFGIVFSAVMINLSTVMFFKGLRTNRLLGLKILGYVLLLTGFVVSAYVVKSYITEEKIVNLLYAVHFSKMISYVIGFTISFFFMAIPLLFIKSDNKEYLIRAAIAIILTMLGQYLLIHFIKRLDCRPRYRFLVDSSFNTNNEVFRNWWEFKPFAFDDDGHKSWPSGHTATAAVSFLLPLAAPVLRYPFKHSKQVLFLIGLASIILIAFFRIYHGAHFLSDVSFGCLFTLLLALLWVYLSDKLFRKKKSLLTENLS